MRGHDWGGSRLVDGLDGWVGEDEQITVREEWDEIGKWTSWDW